LRQYIDLATVALEGWIRLSGVTIMPIFLLASLTKTVSADVICCKDEFDYLFVTSSLRNEGTGFCKLTEDDAAKMLLTNGGIGIGCFLHDPSGMATDLRRLLAECNHRDLSKRFGFVRFTEPVEIFLDRNTIRNHLNNRHSKSFEYPQ
jgi:hypothetical protein